MLWEIQDGELKRFRCRVGHAWSPESLLTQQSEALEAARLVRTLLLDRANFATAWPLAGDRQGATRSEESGG